LLYLFKSSLPFFFFLFAVVEDSMVEVSGWGKRISVVQQPSSSTVGTNFDVHLSS